MNKPPSLPKRMFSSVTSLEKAFAGECETRELSTQGTRELFGLVPGIVRDAPTFFSTIDRLWRYEFGVPYENVCGRTVTGTDQYPKVRDLVQALIVAKQHLTSSQQEELIKRLSDRGRHNHPLSELLAIASIPEKCEVTYEPQGVGVGNRVPDWLIVLPDRPDTLLEVKFREADLITHLAEIAESDVEESVPVPTTDCRRLFADAEGKFVDVSPSVRLQGAVVFTRLKPPMHGLARAYASANQSALHFVAITNGEGQAYVLATPGVAAETILDLLGLEESTALVFEDEEGV